MQQWAFPLLGEMLVQDPLLVDRTLEKGSGFVISDSRLAIYRQPFLKSSAAGRSLSATVRNIQLVEAMKEIEAGLKSFAKPTLILWGVDDPWLLTQPVMGLQYNKAIKFVPLAEGQHYPQEHWFKEISPKLINFLGSPLP
jgi:haloalkane dehalogenase